MNDAITQNAKRVVESRFNELSATGVIVDCKEYPEETIFVVRVPQHLLDEATVLGNSLDGELAKLGIHGFVTVRPAEQTTGLDSEAPAISELHTSKATALVNLLTERARTSEMQPSLSYVPDTAANISRVMTPRHHLIFGRRGAGKTSLLLEAKRLVQKQGHQAVWLNIQTFRREPSERLVLWVVSRVFECIQTEFKHWPNSPRIVSLTSQLLTELDNLITVDPVPKESVVRLIPRVNSLIRRYVETSGKRLFIFLDDFHYLPRSIQPVLLDYLHAGVRDCDAWLKIAAIKHLSRWFEPDPPLGLQTGHDADHIDLDVTLEDPLKAKRFLEEVLRTYAHQVSISTLSRLFSSGALDRLVVASGAVPRDYLVLCATALLQARNRASARNVGQTDVNKAAGAAAQVKITELEEDAASNEGRSKAIIDALNVVRGFLLDEKKCTYFRIDFKDKEKNPSHYSILQSLMDVRLIHLVNSSVSDEHRAGEKSEVYMLDLSQYSGHRVKRFLKMLDFVNGRTVLAETGTQAPKKVANTSNDLLTILRRAPLFALKTLVAE